MKNILFLVCLVIGACADNTLNELPLDNNYPLRLIVDAEEGADLPDAEDYDVEIAFADYLGDLPGAPLMLSFSITDLQDDMVGQVEIGKIVYEVEIDDCVFEREIQFSSAPDGLSGTITILPDPDLDDRVPESFEVVLTLPGLPDTEGSFSFELTDLESSDANVILGLPSVFEYSVLDNELAGDWKLTLKNEGEWEQFQSFFGLISNDVAELSFEDITGNVEASFEFEEMVLSVELKETEEECEDGETEEVNAEIEIEMEYDNDEGELEAEGSYEIVGDDGELEESLDFIASANYTIFGDVLTLHFVSLIDEDNYEEGEELYRDEVGVTLEFEKD